MKRIIETVMCTFFAVLMGFSSIADDVYDFKMSLNIPRVYDNEHSLGYRKYQRQKITGEMVFKYDADGKLSDVTLTNVVNKTHKLSSGKNVTYDAYLDRDTLYPKFVLIGSNKTLIFNTACASFYLVAEPNYAIGDAKEDNSMYLLLAGKGKLNKKTGKVVSYDGYAAGNLGCGCMDYGHTSPTRKLGEFGATDTVEDIAPAFGSWKAKYNKRKSKAN